ncbi:hypothetical protein D3C76_1185420 [compost metagenome]
MFALLGDLLPGCANLLLKLLLFPQLFPGTLGFFLFLLLLDLKLVGKMQLIQLEAQVPARYLHAHNFAKAVAGFE